VASNRVAIHELRKIVKERGCGFGTEPNFPHNFALRGSYIGDMRTRKTNSAVAQESEEQSLQPAIKDAISLLRRHRLSYDQSLYVIKSARKAVGLDRPTVPKKLPKSLSAEEIARLFTAVRKSGKVEHELMYRLFLVTAVRCAEMTNIRRSDVSLSEGTIRITQGKGSKDRVVPFPSTLRLALELHLRATEGQRWLFETRQRKKYSTRWIQELSKTYGEQAGLRGFHAHLLRHTALTKLSVGIVDSSGGRVKLSDAQIQVVSGHSQRSSLEVYTQLGLGNVRDEYEQIMTDQSE
jgi:integrase/recombinase XerD